MERIELMESGLLILSTLFKHAAQKFNFFINELK